MLRLAILISLTVTLLSSCSSNKPQGKTHAEIVYKEAQDLIKEERYILATEKLNFLRSKFPYSYYATHAELLQADVLFKQESFEEAATAYLAFKELHPKHKEKTYVVWMIAESYFNQLPDTFDRDLSVGKLAIKYYEELALYHGDSKYLEKAKSKVKFCKELFEKKEKYVADFYFKTEIYKAARYRYEIIIDLFKNKKLLSHSTERIVESSYQMKDYKRCVKDFNKYKIYLTAPNRKSAEITFDKCSKRL